jgi:hypothetical protein
MSMSKKQLFANRKNARQSTGPKTRCGKRISARNSTKHGLYSTAIIINSPHLKEDPNEYTKLINSLFSELKPKGMFQKQLVIRIANCLWRSKRAILAETAEINTSIANMDLDQMRGMYENDFDDCDNPEQALTDYLNNRVATRVVPKTELAVKITRYEMRLDRQLSRAYTLLRHLQATDSSRSLSDSGRPQLAVGSPRDTDSLSTCALPSDCARQMSSSAPAAQTGTENEKQQNEPISPQPETPQQNTAPPETGDAAQNDQLKEVSTSCRTLLPSEP